MLPLSFSVETGRKVTPVASRVATRHLKTDVDRANRGYSTSATCRIVLRLSLLVWHYAPSKAVGTACKISCSFFNLVDLAFRVRRAATLISLPGMKKNNMAAKYILLT